MKEFNQAFLVPLFVRCRLCSLSVSDIYLGIGAWNGIGTGIVGTIGYVVLPTGVSTDVSRDIV